MGAAITEQDVPSYVMTGTHTHTHTHKDRREGWEREREREREIGSTDMQV